MFSIRPCSAVLLFVVLSSFCCCSVVQSWLTTPISFSSKPATRRSKRRLMMAEPTASSEEPDLFDYFDPLLSPHEYPNGISPQIAKKPTALEVDSTIPQQQQHTAKDDSETTAAATTTETKVQDDTDLFDYFDPLMSPHAYPNGINGNKQSKVEAVKEADDRYDPLKFPEFVANQKNALHESTSGGSSKIGILLMDHGSKNEASNLRLESLAQLYQLTMADANVVVRAAHMEIVSPSIEEGLQALLKEGVDEIVCHPYFLSPGRHVVEDIPRLMEEAIASLNIEIPIITTDPVGSNTQLMIGAIHSLVRENSQLMRQKKN